MRLYLQCIMAVGENTTHRVGYQIVIRDKEIEEQF